MAHVSGTTATETDVLSLSTIYPRAFHKGNVYGRNAIPDTPLIRAWWSELFRDEILDPKCHVLIIVDSNVTSFGDRHVVGVLLLRRMDADEPGAGVFGRHPPTADHDLARYAAMLEGTVGPREKHMAGRPHLLLEMFGVDDEYQRKGLGRKLLLKACEIANSEGVDIFVQANTSAKLFYEKHGFVCMEEVLLPGPEKYGEALLVYRASKGR